MNLSEFVINPYTKSARFDNEAFKKSTRIAIRALDEVIDYGYEHHALQSQRDMAYNHRNIGLGIMGLGSVFFKMGLTYGSKESLNLIDSIMNEMFREAIFASNELAKEKGTFPKYNDKIFESTIIKNHFTDKEIKELKKYGLRNCSLLSVAPSGSIATMLNITTGCEPAFRISYRRKTESLHKGGEVYYEVYIKEAEEYKKLNGTDILPIYFISSESIDFRDRIAIQAIVQNHVDTAISSTINLPETTTVKEIEELYLLSWKQGLKGVTIFRDGCRRTGILTTGDKKENGEQSNELQRGEWKPLAEDTIYIKEPLNIGCGKLKLFIGYSPSENAIQDLYIKKAGIGGCTHNVEAVAVGLSAVYRLGGSTKNIEKAFSGLGGCNSFLQSRINKKELSKGSSCATAILNILKETEKRFNLEPVATKIETKISAQEEQSVFSKEELEYKKKHGDDMYAKYINKCPICNEPIVPSGSCYSCICGYSKCE